MNEQIEKLAGIISTSHGYVFPSGDEETDESFRYWANQVIDAGYLPVEPVQLESLPSEEMAHMLAARDTGFYASFGRQVSQATNTYNESKGQLYRRVE